MKLERIKELVSAGVTVHWGNIGYEVIKDRLGQYMIFCSRTNSYTGLTDVNDVMNENEDDFFVPPVHGNVLLDYSFNRADRDQLPDDQALREKLAKFTESVAFAGLAAGGNCGVASCTIDSVDYSVRWRVK
jgi:hypothetical protein